MWGKAQETKYFQELQHFVGYFLGVDNQLKYSMNVIRKHISFFKHCINY